MLFSDSCDEISLVNARLSLYHNFLPSAVVEHLFNDLHNELAWQQDQVRIAGNRINIPRLQAWYGDFAYTYSGIHLSPHPWTQSLLEIKHRIEALGFSFNTMLANLYRNGHDSVAWHADDEQELGERATIASLSLGATRRFEIKAKKTNAAEKPDIHMFAKKKYLELANNSLLIMHAPLQQYYVHQVPKQAQISEPRINLTFRKIII